MKIGPQVAFVDDIEEQIKPIEEAIQKLNAGTVFFNARPDLAEYPEKPYDTVELVFLDLYYKKDFDAYACAQWVQSIVPANSRYSLVIWSKDPHEKEALYRILEEIDLAPAYTESWQKDETDPKFYNFSEKISGLMKNISREGEILSEVIYGEIVDVEDDAVLVNCRINKEKPVFQVRRFDKALLANVKNLENGAIVKIIIHTKPGARLVDIFEEKKDMKDWFTVPDFFSGLEGNSFFIQG